MTHGLRSTRRPTRETRARLRQRGRAHRLPMANVRDADASDAQETAEGIGPKGAATKISCPAFARLLAGDDAGLDVSPHAEGATNPKTLIRAFSGLITERPTDESLPQVQPDAPPADDSGLPGRQSAAETGAGRIAGGRRETRVSVPLLSNIHTQLLHRTTLELSFHLAVKATVRLIAKRKGRSWRARRRRRSRPEIERSCWRSTSAAGRRSSTCRRTLWRRCRPSRRARRERTPSAPTPYC